MNKYKTNIKEEVIQVVECDEWKKLTETQDSWEAFEV
tara:strand:- start:398 stop:508 length:111 start_codon:yes stop_codon:yes gene_type:complete